MNLNEIILDQRPWGRAVGLLVACSVILVGIFRSVGPAEIVLRAVTAAIVSAIFVRLFVWTLQQISETGPDQDPG